MLMVNGLGQNHLKWLQVRRFYKDHVYFVDLWITFIHSWGGLEFQLKVCVEERKEKIWWYARKKWGFFIMTAFSPTFPEKNQNIIYIFLNHSVNERNKISWCGKLFALMDISAWRRAKFFLPNLESKGSELSGVVNLLEVDIYNCYGVFYCDVSLSITDCC